MVEDALLAEMRALQEKVAGITGTAVASRDGLIVREDTGGVDPDNLAALAATWLALAQRMSTEVGQGVLREATTRSSGGSVTIYAIAARAVLVIIARGPVVDQAALVQALQEGRLAGAGLDVTDPEPLPPDDPLWSAPNALITPHVAGYGADVPARRALALIETNLRRYLAGEPLTSVVPVPPRTERPMST